MRFNLSRVGSGIQAIRIIAPYPQRPVNPVRVWIFVKVRIRAIREGHRHLGTARKVTKLRHLYVARDAIAIKDEVTGIRQYARLEICESLHRERMAAHIDRVPVETHYVGRRVYSRVPQQRKPSKSHVLANAYDGAAHVTVPLAGKAELLAAAIGDGGVGGDAHRRAALHNRRPICRAEPVFAAYRIQSPVHTV